jgi:beta-xylosidase
MIFVRLDDGREIGTPLEWYPKLRDASKRDLENWRFIGNGIGIHWESMDEDLSIRGLLH